MAVDNNIYILLVALITWGGVFIYLLKLDKTSKALEEEVRALEMGVKESKKSIEANSPISPL